MYMDMERVDFSNGEEDSEEEDDEELKSNLLYSETHADVHFVCQLDESTAEPIPAQKEVLSQSSPVFDAMFGSDWAESGKDAQICVQDMTSTTFRTLLQYLYTNQCDLTPENVLEVLYAARKYLQVDLVEQCMDMIDYHTLDVLNSNAFKDVDCDTLCGILKRDTLDIKEFVLYDAIVQWSQRECKWQDLEVNEENQKIVLEKVVPFIRFTLMTYDELAIAMEKCLCVSYDILADLIACYDDKSKKESLPFNLKERQRRKKVVIVGGEMYGYKQNDEILDYNTASGSKGLGITLPCGKQDLSVGLYIPEEHKAGSSGDVQASPLIIIAGGRTALFPRPCCEPEASSSKAAFIYNINEETMKMTTEMNEERKCAVSGVHGNKFYMFGGGSNDKTCECYDFESKTWTKTNDLPHCKSQGCGVCIGGGIIVFGGYDTHNYILEYVAGKGYWKQFGYAPFSLVKATAIKYNNKIVVSGGFLSETLSRKVWTMDPKENRWRPLPPLLTKRAYHAMADVQGKLLVLGGKGKRGEWLRSVEIFDGKRWQYGKNLHVAMSNFSVCVL